MTKFASFPKLHYSIQLHDVLRSVYLPHAKEFEFHPLIKRIFEEPRLRLLPSTSWLAVVHEWPHVSEENPEQLAYTRAGHEEAMRYTRTTIGRYIARHWSHLPDHLVRDLTALHSPEAYEIRGDNDYREIIMGVECGPQSCMKSCYGSIPFDSDDNRQMRAWLDDPEEDEPNWDYHPYKVYAPELGWRMAVRFRANQPREVLGRALVHEDKKCFVRSYKRPPSEGAWSVPDDALNAWLESMGYRFLGEWPQGVRILRLDHPRESGIMIPYTDGGCRQWAEESRHNYMRLERGGCYTADNTDGSTQFNDDSVGDCEECGDGIGEDDDYTQAGRDGDILVCGSCLSRHFTYVRGRSRWENYREYYVRDDSAVDIDGDDYDEDYLPECVVSCADGDHHHIDNCVLCEDGEYRMSEECKEVDGEWYPEDEVVLCADGCDRLEKDCVEYDGEWYHEDETRMCADDVRRPVGDVILCSDGKYRLTEEVQGEI